MNSFPLLGILTPGCSLLWGCCNQLKFWAVGTLFLFVNLVGAGFSFSWFNILLDSWINSLQSANNLYLIQAMIVDLHTGAAVLGIFLYTSHEYIGHIFDTALGYIMYIFGISLIGKIAILPICRHFQVYWNIENSGSRFPLTTKSTIRNFIRQFFWMVDWVFVWVCRY